MHNNGYWTSIKHQTQGRKSGQHQAKVESQVHWIRCSQSISEVDFSSLYLEYPPVNWCRTPIISLSLKGFPHGVFHIFFDVYPRYLEPLATTQADLFLCLRLLRLLDAAWRRQAGWRVGTHVRWRHDHHNHDDDDDDDDDDMDSNGFWVIYTYLYIQKVLNCIKEDLAMLIEGWSTFKQQTLAWDVWFYTVMTSHEEPLRRNHPINNHHWEPCSHV